MAQYNIGDSRVLDSREVGGGLAIRRRRESADGKRFTTYERIEKPDLVVIKRDGSRELFDRNKLKIALQKSVGKFFDSEIDMDQMVDNVEDFLYDIGGCEITSKQIGDQVLEELAQYNEVAYVRFASVYYKFKTLDDFVRTLNQKKLHKGTKQ